MQVTRFQLHQSDFRPDDGLHVAMVDVFTRHSVLSLSCSARMSQSAYAQDVRAALICDAIRQLHRICAHQGQPAPEIARQTLAQAA